MCNTAENFESAFATSFGASTLPRWQRKAMQQLASPDRFIPNRSSSSIEESHFHLTRDEAAEECAQSPAKLDFQRAMAQSLFPDTGSKVLAFAQQAPKAREGYLADQRVLYTQARAAAAPKKATRHIPQSADRILDAPDLKSDFYLNILDWSASNVVAVALGSVCFGFGKWGEQTPM